MTTNKLSLRMCVACRKMLPKEELFRVSYDTDTECLTVFDGNGKQPNGRGAYVCKNRACIELCAKKRLLNKHLKAIISVQAYETLKEFIPNK